ncbi:MAG: DUF932 domain-containing protein [Thermoplasmata archaeon]
MQENGAAPRRAAFEPIASPEEIPDYSLVPLQDPQGGPATEYRGVRREDTGTIVSVVSRRYGLVGHREVAQAIARIGAALERPSEGSLGPGFPRESIRLYAGGRRMEIKLVVGRRFRLGDGEELYPGLRLMNSLDGSWAVRLSGFAVRLACQNQLYAEQGNVTEWRELHRATGTDLMAELTVAIHRFLGSFHEGLGLYVRAMHEEILAAEVDPALQAEGLPARHAGTIGARVEAQASHVAALSRWAAYQTATAYLTREVVVGPDREREFERGAARALLRATIPSRGAAPA